MSGIYTLLPSFLNCSDYAAIVNPQSTANQVSTLKPSSPTTAHPSAGIDRPSAPHVSACGARNPETPTSLKHDSITSLAANHRLQTPPLKHGPFSGTARAWYPSHRLAHRYVQQAHRRVAHGRASGMGRESLPQHQGPPIQRDTRYVQDARRMLPLIDHAVVGYEKSSSSSATRIPGVKRRPSRGSCRGRGC